MYKSHDKIKFPESVQLFNFCLRVLSVRNPNIKIRDQDLGSILKFSASDTSNWKNGKKEIRNIQLTENLATYLDIDHEIIEDLLEGITNFDEAWNDFCDAEEERRLAREEPGVRIERRDKSFELEKLAKDILNKLPAQYNIPIHVPDLVKLFPFIQLIPDTLYDRLARSSRIKPGHYLIRYRKGDLRAHTRFAIVREMVRIILLSEHDTLSLSHTRETLAQAEIFDLASALLVPREILATEIQKISTRKNMIKSLAEIFLVSKAVIRARLTTILLEHASNAVFTTPVSEVEQPLS